MNNIQRSILFVLAPLVGIGTLGFHEGVFALPRRPVETISHNEQQTLVIQPTYWVSLSAEYKRIHERNGATFVGHQYRNGDGSTRNESGRTFDSIDLIAIKNIPEAKFYSWTPEGGWTAQPMTLPPDGWKPFGVEYSQKLIDVPDTAEGFKLVRLESNGRVFFQAPELNLFTLITLVKCEFDAAKQCGTWYTNIKLGEPPVDFAPPKDAKVTELKTPGGIVFKPGQ